MICACCGLWLAVSGCASVRSDGGGLADPLAAFGQSQPVEADTGWGEARAVVPTAFRAELAPRQDEDVPAITDAAAGLQVQEEIALPLKPADAVEEPIDLDLDLKRPISRRTLDILPTQGPLPQDHADKWMSVQETIHYSGEVHPEGLVYPVYLQSPDFCHRPLYFQQCALERYGVSCGILQPLVSATQFYATFPMLPYKMMVECPYDCYRTYGPYLPGACGPCPGFLPPLRLDGGLAEAGAIAGLILLIP